MIGSYLKSLEVMLVYLHLSFDCTLVVALSLYIGIEKIMRTKK
jgi:hypothetical protein